MMDYDIWIVITGIFKVVLDLEVRIKFLNSNHISQQAVKLEHKYTTTREFYQIIGLKYLLAKNISYTFKY